MKSVKSSITDPSRFILPNSARLKKKIEPLLNAEEVNTSFIYSQIFILVGRT